MDQAKHFRFSDYYRHTLHSLSCNRRLQLAGLLSLLLASPAFAQTAATAKNGQLLLRSANGEQQQAVLLNTDVSMDISGLSNRVRLRQSFTNDSPDWQEGTYVFPLPEDSAVNKLRLLLDERVIVGEIHERGVAREIYQQAQREGRKAALVEQQRPNLFTQKVANIAPGETVTVELQYIQAVHYDSGHFSLRFPMTVTPRYIPGTPLTGLSAQSFAAPNHWALPTTAVADADAITPQYLPPSASNPLTLTVHLQAGLPVSNVQSASHKVQKKALGTGNSEFQLSLQDTGTAMDRDFELEWEPQAGSAPQAAMFYDSVGDATFVQLMLLPPQVSAALPHVPRELIIVLDTSGSMAGTSIAAARQSVELALSRLQGDDYFNVIEFNSNYRSLFPVSLPANAYNIRFAQNFVHNLAAGGGTEIYPALAQALVQTPAANTETALLKQVVFVTDGSVGNEDAILAMIKQKLGETRLFTIGIGSAPNSYFMRKAAETGRGTYTHVGTLDEIAPRMETLLYKLEHAVLLDAKIQWPAGVVAEFYPARVPDLYAGEPVFVIARLDGMLPATSEFSVSGLVAGQRWERQLKLSSLPPAANNRLNDSALAAYWARQKIETLQDSLRTGIDAAQVRNDVLAVALPYQLLSPYTSFVATETTVSRPGASPVQSAAVRNQPPAGQELASEMGHQSLQLNYPRTAAGIDRHFLLGLWWGLLAMALIYCQLRHKEWHD